MNGSYYNEIDPSAAAWIRELIRHNLVAPGDVDERSIVDVRPSDLVGYRQCHFFAGIAVWSYALRLAGWPDEREVWTGSCPCQPFSAAGKGKGYADERHLWPHWYRLISECLPSVCFGEQVDAAIRTGWLDDVCLSLESLGYAVGAVSFPACSVGAPHIRQRLYFCGSLEYAAHNGQQRGIMGNEASTKRGSLVAREDEGRGGYDASNAGTCRELSSMADSANPRRDDTRQHGRGSPSLPARSAERREPVELGHPSQRGLGIDGSAPRDTGHADEPGQAEFMGNAASRRAPAGEQPGQLPSAIQAGPVNGFWSNAEWIAYRDGKARPTEPGVAPLVAGAAARVVRGGDSSASFDANNSPEARVMRLRGYGNSINAAQAAEFVCAYMSIEQ